MTTGTQKLSAINAETRYIAHLKESLYHVSAEPFLLTKPNTTPDTLATTTTLHTTMNKTELINEFKNVDEITLIELLGVTSEDLVDAFLDQIEDNQVKLIKYLNDN